MVEKEVKRVIDGVPIEFRLVEAHIDHHHPAHPLIPAGIHIVVELPLLRPKSGIKTIPDARKKAHEVLSSLVGALKTVDEQSYEFWNTPKTSGGDAFITLSAKDLNVEGLENVMNAVIEVAASQQQMSDGHNKGV